MTSDERTKDVRQVAQVTCRLCRGSGRIAVGPWGVRPAKKTCPECLGEKTLPEDHHYQDPTV
jgi:DnaJ-class molecular chaperone